VGAGHPRWRASPTICTFSNVGIEEKQQIPKSAGQADVTPEHARRPNHPQRAADGQGVNAGAVAAVRRQLHDRARAAEGLGKSHDAEADRNEKSNPRSRADRLPWDGTAERSARTPFARELPFCMDNRRARTVSMSGSGRRADEEAPAEEGSKAQERPAHLLRTLDPRLNCRHEAALGPRFARQYRHARRDG